MGVASRLLRNVRVSLGGLTVHHEFTEQPWKKKDGTATQFPLSINLFYLM